MTTKQASFLEQVEKAMVSGKWMPMLEVQKVMKKAGFPHSLPYLKRLLDTEIDSNHIEKCLETRSNGQRGRLKTLYRYVGVSVAQSTTPEPPHFAPQPVIELKQKNADFPPTSLKELGDAILGEIALQPEEPLYDVYKAWVPTHHVAFSKNQRQSRVHVDDIYAPSDFEIIRRVLSEHKTLYVQPVPATDLELEGLVRHYAAK